MPLQVFLIKPYSEENSAVANGERQIQWLEKYSNPLNCSTFCHIPTTNVNVFYWDFMWLTNTKKGVCNLISVWIQLFCEGLRGLLENIRHLRDKVVEKFKQGEVMKKYAKLWTSHVALLNPLSENGKSMSPASGLLDCAWRSFTAGCQLFWKWHQNGWQSINQSNKLS